ncbi:MAG: hypothetical protein ABSG25_04145 [Bryobacteraceae bacterium]
MFNLSTAVYEMELMIQEDLKKTDELAQDIKNMLEEQENEKAIKN